jgi:hypothetical protein
MVVIQVQIGKNTREDVLLNGGSGVNIIIEQLRLRLGLPKPKPTPYNLRMVDQTTTKPVGLIRDMKIYVHGIPDITTFIIFQNSMVDFNHSMLLVRPWLRDAKMAHDWGSNIITIQANGTIRTITVTKHLGNEVRRPKMLLCYDYQNGITNEKKNIIFVTKPKVFSVGRISLHETIQSMKTIDVGIMDIDVKTSISK